MQFSERDYREINSIASLVKQFLRELPEPLLTEAHSGDFVRALGRPTDSERVQAISAAFKRIPPANFETVRALCHHICRVAEHDSVNKMSVGNLAVCFAPTLLSSRAPVDAVEAAARGGGAFVAE